MARDLGAQEEADNIIAMLRGIDGVDSMRMGIVKHFVTLDDWLSNEIDKRVNHIGRP